MGEVLFCWKEDYAIYPPTKNLTFGGLSPSWRSIILLEGNYIPFIPQENIAFGKAKSLVERNIILPRGRLGWQIFIHRKHTLNMYISSHERDIIFLEVG